MLKFVRMSAMIGLVALCASAATPVVLESARAHTVTGAFQCSITGATVATPSVLTCAAVPFVSGDQIQITGVGGTTTDNTLAYAKVLSPTTFSIYSDAALSTGITGTGSYTSGGVATMATDISALTGDWTIKLVVNSLTAAKNAVLCLQDSADGFVSDIVTLACVNPSGPINSGATGSSVSYSWRRYQIPSLRIGASSGVSNARLRLNVTQIDGSASVNTTLSLFQ